MVLGEIRKRIHLGDWDAARRMLRSIAWETHRHSSQEFKDAFKEAMCGFAMQDPLFNLMLPPLKHHIMENAGCMQSAIYRHFPAFDVEDQRYVLYYGEAIGHVVRVKKGNSYALYLPGHPDIPSQVVDDSLTDDEQAFLQEMRAKTSIRLPCSDYWQRRLGNPDRLLKRLAAQGHFRSATLPELLQQLTKPQLAAALKQQGLPVSGSKTELVGRLCDHAPDSAEALVSDLHVYIPT